jgi:hypothetical protein
VRFFSISFSSAPRAIDRGRCDTPVFIAHSIAQKVPNRGISPENRCSLPNLKYYFQTGRYEAGSFRKPLLYPHSTTMPDPRTPRAIVSDSFRASFVMLGERERATAALRAVSSFHPPGFTYALLDPRSPLDVALCFTTCHYFSRERFAATKSK